MENIILIYPGYDKKVCNFGSVHNTWWWCVWVGVKGVGEELSDTNNEGNTFNRKIDSLASGSGYLSP